MCGCMFVCMWVHTNVVHMHMCVHYYEGQMVISSVFLTFSLPTEEGSSLNLELTDLVSIITLLALGNSCLLLPNTRTTDGHYATQPSHGFWGSVLHPHCCPADTFPMELPHSPRQ